MRTLWGEEKKKKRKEGRKSSWTLRLSKDWEELLKLTKLPSRWIASTHHLINLNLFPFSLSRFLLLIYLDIPSSVEPMHLARHSVSSVPVPSFNSLIINHDGDHFAVATDQGFEVWKLYPLATVARRGTYQFSYPEWRFERW